MIDNRVSSAVIEAGYLFNSAHVKQKTFKSPKFYEQMHAADDADVPIGLWMTCRATSEDEAKAEIKEILSSVYDSLLVKGYNPINQLVGYIISEDPTYITNYNNARSMICKIDRDELMQVLVREYLFEKE